MTTKVRGNKIQRKQRHMTTKDEDNKGTRQQNTNQKGKWAKR